MSSAPGEGVSAGPARHDVAVVVPVKPLIFAKGRLAPLLNPSRRRQLALAMLEDVLEALAGVAGLAERLVVSADPEVLALAPRWGVELLRESRSSGDGYNHAVRQAERAVGRSSRAGALLVLPADVPLVSPAEIATVIGVSTPVGIVPSADGRGTNALLRRPPSVMPARFGPDSYRRHLALAARRGLAATTLHLPGLAHDLDLPHDLAALLAPEARPTRASHLLRQWGVHLPRERDQEGGNW